MQMHLKPPRSSMHVPSFIQGPLSHSLTLTSHLGPANPGSQSHRKEPGVLTQTPLCSQGDPEGEKEIHWLVNGGMD